MIGAGTLPWPAQPTGTMNDSSFVQPGTRPTSSIGLPSALSLRAKGLGMLMVVVLYALFMAVYATTQKNQLLERFNELQELHESESELLLIELAAFRDITEFFLFIDAELVKQPENLREQIQALQQRQLAVMARYPEIAPTFAGLSHALARAISAPGNEALAEVRAQLANTQRHLQQLAGQITTRQRVLADEYYSLGDAAAMNSLLFGLAGVITIGLVAMYFFTGMTRDIKRLEQRVDDVVHGYRGAPLPVRRHDELGQLTRDVNRMVEELAQREDDLDVERRKTFQQEKMASIGTLAAGIVHEIGNPVAAISGLLGSLEMEQQHAPDSHDSRLEKLHMVQQQVERLAAIARDVSDFAVPQSGKALGRPDIRTKIQLVQLLMNLMINAADAMEGEGEGERTPRIAISTFRVGSGAGLQVEDNGHGMDEATLEKALDPFFTTKGAGKGTGLGLPLCYTVVNEHGGTISFDSKPGVGTRVRVILPADGRARPRDEEARS